MPPGEGQKVPAQEDYWVSTWMAQKLDLISASESTGLRDVDPH